MNDNNDIIKNIKNNYDIVKNNQIILQNLKNYRENINLLLDIKNTLIIENCDNIIINIPKITQILIIKSKNIIINYVKPIIGIFISKSNNIKLNETFTNNTDITIEFYNSHYININTNNNIFILIYCIEIIINNISIFLNFFSSCCFIMENNITYF
jgi:hypothetical protein